MARQIDDRGGLGIGAIVGGAIFALLVVVSAFLIFHPGAELSVSDQQFANEPARVPVMPDVNQAPPRAPKK